MGYGVKVEVWGDYALFTRPEMKVERVSYDVMTPSAARGLIEAVFWHPGLKRWIDKIHVLAPIRFTNVRRNEVKAKVLGSNVKAAIGGGDTPLYISTVQNIQQRASLVLRDVRYVIEAHFKMTDRAAPGDNEGKFKDTIRRRLEHGQCYHQPYFGTREFPARFRPWEGEAIPAIDETRDLGYMLYDMDYSVHGEIVPLFFRASLERGVLDLTDCEVRR